MRNARAAFDDAASFEVAPRVSAARKRASRASRPPRKPDAAGKRKPGGTGRPLLHRMARYAAFGMGAAIALGVMVNALLLQKGRHPAPLFATAHVTTMPARKAQQAAVAADTSPAPPGRPIQAETDPVADHSQAPAEPPPIRDAAAPPRREDAIGRLLAGETPAGRSRVDGRTVMSVQRALSKVGFKVPATGTFGPTTRKAIEAFEKDRHMPAKGDIDRRLVKVLAAASGLHIE